MPNFIRVNLFPATVTVGDEVFTPVRAVVTDESFHVYADSSEGPKEVYNARLDDFEGRALTGYTVTTHDGAVAHVKQAEGCGCGSRLRGFNPFRGIGYLPS